MPRLVVFDAAGTLLEVAGSVGEAYVGFASRAGAALDGARGREAAQAVERGFARAMRGAPPLAFGGMIRSDREAAERTWWRDVAREALAEAGILEQVSFDLFFDLAWDGFGRADAWRVPPDVRPGLRALRAAGVPLAVFSNWDGRLPGVLASLSLDGFFARIVVSGELAAAKPDPAAYREVAEMLGGAGVTWRGAPVMVGDRVEQDVAPALAAGWDAIRLDRRGSAGPRTVPRAASLTEVAERLAAAVR